MLNLIKKKKNKFFLNLVKNFKIKRKILKKIKFSKKYYKFLFFNFSFLLKKFNKNFFLLNLKKEINLFNSFFILNNINNQNLKKRFKFLNFLFFFWKNSFFNLYSFKNSLTKIRNTILSSFKIVNFDTLISLIKKFNYDKIFNYILKKFIVIHLYQPLVLKKFNRIFILYTRLKKFLVNYWRLKYKFFFSNLELIWSINEKVYIILWQYKYIIGKIFVRKTATNFIVTFTDLFGKVIYCCTSFSSLSEKATDKRRRLSIFAMEDIVSKLFIPIYLSDINRIIIVSRIKMKVVLYTLYRRLKIYGFKVLGYIKEFVNPHNGVKLGKKKRK